MVHAAFSFTKKVTRYYYSTTDTIFRQKYFFNGSQDPHPDLDELK
jgi:hypothetical protein